MPAPQITYDEYMDKIIYDYITHCFAYVRISSVAMSATAPSSQRHERPSVIV